MNTSLIRTVPSLAVGLACVTLSTGCLINEGDEFPSATGQESSEEALAIAVAATYQAHEDERHTLTGTITLMPAGELADDDHEHDDDDHDHDDDDHDHEHDHAQPSIMTTITTMRTTTSPTILPLTD